MDCAAARKAFPYEHRFQYLIFDRDPKFGNEVLSAVESIELAWVRTSFKSPDHLACGRPIRS